MQIATLGPKGTCSEAAAVSYLKKKNLTGIYKIILSNTFEDVIQDLISDNAQIAIVPCAYVNYNKLLFSNLGEIKIYDVMHEETPPFVLASMRASSAFNTEDEFTISSHPSPAPLIKKIPYKCKCINTDSNVVSAQMVVNGLTDLCITTTKAINAIQESSIQPPNINILKYFGPADMIWIIFSKAKNGNFSALS